LDDAFPKKTANSAAKSQWKYFLNREADRDSSSGFLPFNPP